MLERLRTLLAAPLTAALLFALLDFVLEAHVHGAGSDSYAAVALPLAFFVACAFAAGVIGAAIGALAAPRLAASRAAVAVGCGLAGAATAGLVILAGQPFPAFTSWPRQALLWIGVWAALALLLYAAAGSHPGRIAGRILQAAPPALLGLACYQVLSAAPSPLRWAGLAAGVAVAAWTFARPAQGLLVNAVLASAALIAPWLGPPEPNLEPPRGIAASAPLHPPRIILITLDTLRADEPGFTGGTTSTPSLDRLASESAVFEQAYSTSGWTLPALASLHLGVSPWVHGAWTWADRPSTGPLSLAERFHSAGYLTAKVANNFFLTQPGSGSALEQGFQTRAAYPKRVRPRTAAFEFLVARPWFDLKVDATTGDLFAWAQRWVEANQASPFFLWLHIYDPHQPYLPPADFAPGGVAPAPDDPAADPERRPKSPAEAERMRALYRGEIAYVDNRLGQFLDRLWELGLYQDSLIALTSDHGDEFHEHGGFGHGHTLHDELLRVPLVLKLPGASEPKRIPGRVSTLGLAPTLLELANVRYQPQDFSAGPMALANPDSQPIFAAGIMEGEPQEAVLFDGLKLIRHTGFGVERLYDLEADPAERVNLAPQRPEDVRRGVALLQQQADEARALRDRLGISGGRAPDYGPAEKKTLRSLGYIQ